MPVLTRVVPPLASPLPRSRLILYDTPRDQMAPHPKFPTTPNALLFPEQRRFPAAEALRGIEADFGPEHADTFRRDLQPDLHADYALANPPFNDSDWFRKDDDVRFFSLSASNGERVEVGCRNDWPPKGNANFAWVQHFIHHLAPHGMAGYVLANGSMSSNQSGEGDIRRALGFASYAN